MAAELVVRLNELCTSERDFADGFRILLRNLNNIIAKHEMKYSESLSFLAKAFSAEDFHLIESFAQECDVVYLIHEQFSQLIEPHPQSIEAVVSALTELLPSLTQAHFEYDMLAEDFLAFITRLSASDASGTFESISPRDWQDMIVRPTQRFLRYPLFLDALSKAHPPSSQMLEPVRQQLRSAITSMNDRKRQHAMSQRAASIFPLIDAMPADLDASKLSSRRLLQEGRFAQNDKRGPRQVFLFEDFLLSCKPRATGRYGFKDFISLSGLSAGDVASMAPLNERVPRLVIYGRVFTSEQGEVREWRRSLDEIARANDLRRRARERAAEIRGVGGAAPTGALMEAAAPVHTKLEAEEEEQLFVM
jgi:hypothetical protein